MSFKDLGLMPELLRAISDEGYHTPTAIQQQAIPLILEGGDLLAGAQTGTGKTAGFTLPLLQHLSLRSKQRGLRALILVPTRELASQVGESVRTYGKYLPLRSAIVFGGVSMHAQVKSLRSGVDVVIATPGRLLDHIGQKSIDLSKIEILVLDEADRMLDMGFVRDIRKILPLLPKVRQSLLFSATFSNEIKGLAASFLNSPKTIEAVRHNTPTDLVAQVVHPVDNKRKRALLGFLITSQNLRQVLVFTRTKHCADKLSEHLIKEGITATAIHGNKSQSARSKALSEFKRNQIRVLVATDIAARGLDIDQLSHVINFELPQVPEDYVHRIGRTGRAGNEGEAISLVCVDEHKLLRDIERLLKTKLPTSLVPGYEPDPSIRAEPIPNGRNRSFGRPSSARPRSHFSARSPRTSRSR